MNFNIIPFRYSEETFLSFIPSLLFWYLTNLLGSTNPERNALLQEPLSTSVENYNYYSLSFLVVTTIKIYTNGVSNLIHIKSSTNYSIFSIAPFYLKICILFQFSVWYKLLLYYSYNSFALAPWIFRALSLGWWAITHSLADSCFHGHSPTVYETKRLFWYLD